MKLITSTKWDADLEREVPDIAKVAAALASAQGAYGPVVRDKTVTIKPRDKAAYSFTYAPLENILAAVRDALATNELCLVGGLVKVDDKNYFENRLIHSSGQFLGNLVPVVTDGEGGMKSIGGTITYARRYGVGPLLGVVADDDDDDDRDTGGDNGRQDEDPRQPAEKKNPLMPKKLKKPKGAPLATGPVVSASQLRILRAKLEAAALGEKEISARFEIARLEDLPAESINDALAWIANPS